jgi:hypothetical protein
LFDKAADAIDFAVEADRTDMIQAAWHGRAPAPCVRGRIVFFVEWLVNEPIGVTSEDVDLAAGFGDRDLATGVRQWRQIVPPSGALKRRRFGTSRADAVCLREARQKEGGQDKRKYDWQRKANLAHWDLHIEFHKDRSDG